MSRLRTTLLLVITLVVSVSIPEASGHRHSGVQQVLSSLPRDNKEDDSTDAPTGQPTTVAGSHDPSDTIAGNDNATFGPTAAPTFSLEELLQRIEDKKWVVAAEKAAKELYAALAEIDPIAQSTSQTVYDLCLANHSLPVNMTLIQSLKDSAQILEGKDALLKNYTTELIDPLLEDQRSWNNSYEADAAAAKKQLEIYATAIKRTRKAIGEILEHIRSLIEDPNKYLSSDHWCDKNLPGILQAATHSGISTVESQPPTANEVLKYVLASLGGVTALLLIFFPPRLATWTNLFVLFYGFGVVTYAICYYAYDMTSMSSIVTEDGNRLNS